MKRNQTLRKGTMKNRLFKLLKQGILLDFLRSAFTLTNKITSKFNVIISPTMYLIGRDREKWIYNYDYFRCSSLELVAKELSEKGIAGSVAELGVYRGDFAKYINCLFPTQKLYLFDTFEGFSNKNFKSESNSS